MRRLRDYFNELGLQSVRVSLDNEALLIASDLVGDVGGMQLVIKIVG